MEARSLSDAADAVAFTTNVCPMCREHHSRDEGITIFIRHFECPNCGTVWKDLWCVDCNDRCPTCRAEVEPAAEEGDSAALDEEAIFD